MDGMDSSPQSTNSLRRVRSSSSTQQPFNKGAESATIETLFVHPSVKIVSFTADNAEHGTSETERIRQQAGTLSSSSRLERTIAVGLLRIYRAPGSVAFLSCGSALQPILPKSQCWCLNEDNSQFVLQIRWPSFWRIELPLWDEEYAVKAAGLKEILSSILQFERTHCPFQRGFTVELPEEPRLPVKKKPWTPKSSPDPKGPRRMMPIFDNNSETRQSRHFSLPRLWTSDLVISPSVTSAGDEPSPIRSPKGEDHDADQNNGRVEIASHGEKGHGEPSDSRAHTKTSGIPPDSERSGLLSLVEPHAVTERVDEIHSRIAQSAATEAEIPPKTDIPEAKLQTPSECSTPLPHSKIEPGRRREARGYTPSSWIEGENESDPEDDLSVSSRCASNNSFRSAESWQPNMGQESSSLTPGHRQTLGEEDNSAGPNIESPSPANEGAGRKSTPARGEGHDYSNRGAPSRDSSPPPDHSRQKSLTVSKRRSQLSYRQNSIPMFLIEKTYDALLTPPAHLIAIILKVAAKLSAGEWRGKVYGYDSGGEQIRVQWDYSEDDLSD